MMPVAEIFNVCQLSAATEPMLLVGTFALRLLLWLANSLKLPLSVGSTVNFSITVVTISEIP